MKTGLYDAKDYILRKLPWDLSRPRYMDFQKETIERIAEVDTGFPARLRAAALRILEDEEREDALRRGLTVLAFVGHSGDIAAVERYCSHHDSEVAKFAKTCLFELKRNAKSA